MFPSFAPEVSALAQRIGECWRRFRHVFWSDDGRSGGVRMGVSATDFAVRADVSRSGLFAGLDR